MRSISDFEENEGILTRIFFSTTSPKMIDFLLDHKELDYSLREIAENCQVSVKTVTREMPRLEALGLVMATRKIGKTPLYKLNPELKALELLSEFTMAMSQTEQFVEPQREQPLQQVIEMAIEPASEKN
jgi:DNA-binding transcriptional ArsR family regulator